MDAAEFIKWCMVFSVPIGAGGGGNVINNTGSTDMAIPRFVGTSGTVIEDSLVTISDLGLLTAPGVTANVANIQGSVIFQGAVDGSSIPYAMSINNFTGSQWVWGQEVSTAEWRIAQSLDLTTNVVARFDHATLAAQFASLQNTPIGATTPNTAAFTTISNTLGMQFNVTTVTGLTVSQTGNQLTFSSNPSSLAASGYVVPASGSPVRLMGYQGSATFPVDLSQTIASGTACTFFRECERSGQCHNLQRRAAATRSVLCCIKEN